MRLILKKSIYDEIVEAIEDVERQGRQVLVVVLTKAERHALYKIMRGKVTKVRGVAIKAEDEECLAPF